MHILGIGTTACDISHSVKEKEKLRIVSFLMTPVASKEPGCSRVELINWGLYSAVALVHNNAKSSSNCLTFMVL